jgi:hypothetical protein
MSDVIEQFKSLSVEDAVRWAIRDTDERRAFKAQWPMYQEEALRKGIEKADADIAQFEEAIMKSLAQKREYEALLKRCQARDIALLDIAQKRRKSA